MPEPLIAHRFAARAQALGQAAGGFFALLVVHSYSQAPGFGVSFALDRGDCSSHTANVA
jgi:hypothetical protein